MFLVVFAHVAHINWVWNYIWQFHMPLFFFISGLLFFPNVPFRAFLWKRIKSLYIPYVIFFLLTFGYWALIERHWRGNQYSIGYELIGLPYGTYEGGHLFFNGVLWFLPCLFATELLFYPVGKLNSRIGQVASILLPFTIGQFLLSQHVFWLPFGLHTAFNAVLFYGAGFLLKHHLAEVNHAPRWHQALLLFACFAFQWLFMGRYVSNVKLCTLPYAAIAFGGVFFYMVLSLMIGRQKVVEYIGRNTLVILCLHAPLCRALIYAVAHVANTSTEALRQNSLTALLLSMLAIVCIIPFIECWNRFVKPQIQKL